MQGYFQDINGLFAMLELAVSSMTMIFDMHHRVAILDHPDGTTLPSDSRLWKKARFATGRAVVRCAAQRCGLAELEELQEQGALEGDRCARPRRYKRPVVTHDLEEYLTELKKHSQRMDSRSRHTRRRRREKMFCPYCGTDISIPFAETFISLVGATKKLGSTRQKELIVRLFRYSKKNFPDSRIARLALPYTTLKELHGVFIIDRKFVSLQKEALFVLGPALAGPLGMSSKAIKAFTTLQKVKGFTETVDKEQGTGILSSIFHTHKSKLAARAKRKCAEIKENPELFLKMVYAGEMDDEEVDAIVEDLDDDGREWYIGELNRMEDEILATERRRGHKKHHRRQPAIEYPEHQRRHLAIEYPEQEHRGHY